MGLKKLNSGQSQNEHNLSTMHTTRQRKLITKENELSELSFILTNRASKQVLSV